MVRRGFFVLVIAALASASGAYANSLPAPTGKVIVTVTGAITNTNAEGKARLDRALLEQAGLVDLITATPHTEGPQDWHGIRMSRLREFVGAKGQSVTARALDGYSATIPADILVPVDPLLALDRNGRPMRVRDKGPAWVIFPWDQHPELDEASITPLAVWQVYELHFE